MQVPLNNISSNINMIGLKKLLVLDQSCCCQIRESHYGTLIPVLVSMSHKLVFSRLKHKNQIIKVNESRYKQCGVAHTFKFIEKR